MAAHSSQSPSFPHKITPLLLVGQPDREIAHLRNALEIDPHFAAARQGLEAALSEK